MNSIVKVDVGVAERSREYLRESQDVILIDRDFGIYGVFDGMGGGGGNPRAAAQIASDAMQSGLQNFKYCDNHEFAKSQMRSVINNARQEIKRNEYGGSTVLTVAKLAIINSKPVAVVGHAGDTRMFVLNERGFVESVTEDQSSGSLVYNGLFFDYDDPDPPDQFLVLGLDAIQRIMICSDGITGDVEAEKISTDDFLDAMTQPTAQESADVFMEISRKNDDKAVVVLDIDKIE